MKIPYPVTLIPGLAGVLVGFAVAWIAPGDTALARAYIALPDFVTWQMVMVIQVTVYITLFAYLWIRSLDGLLPRLSAGHTVATGLAILLAVLLPTAVGQVAGLPLQGHQYRLWVAVATGLLAMLFLTNRLARVHLAFGQTEALPRYLKLHRESKDLLAMAAVVVTLATLGSAVLQGSLQSLEAVFEGYRSPLHTEHVVAYGAYFSLILCLFFAPVLVADRAAAVRVREALTSGSDVDPGVEARLGLDSSLSERIGSAFGVLAPLLGALISQLIPW